LVFCSHSKVETYASCGKWMQFMNSWFVVQYCITWLLKMNENKMCSHCLMEKMHVTSKNCLTFHAYMGGTKSLENLLAHYNLKTNLVEHLWVKKSFNVGWNKILVIFCLPLSCCFALFQFCIVYACYLDCFNFVLFVHAKNVYQHYCVSPLEFAMCFVANWS
jgi:hypothetical protein